MSSPAKPVNAVPPTAPRQQRLLPGGGHFGKVLLSICEGVKNLARNKDLLLQPSAVCRLL